MVTVFSLGFKGYHSLINLNEHYLRLIDCVVIGRDKSIADDFSDKIFDWCTLNKIKTVERKDFSFSDSNSLYFILMGWRWLVPIQENRQTIVFHDSLLPKYRGFNPLVTALLEGDREIGATALFATEEFDKGEIIAQKVIRIEYPIRINDAISLIAELYLGLLNMVFDLLDKSTHCESFPQNEDDATYSLWRDEEDYKIDWSESSERILRKIHATGFPYKGAFFILNNEKIRILDASLLDDLNIVNRDFGKILFKRNGFPVVVCGKGLLVLTDCRNEEGDRIDFFTIRTRLK
jgi:methionyl-tRNA formyltransferase